MTLLDERLIRLADNKAKIVAARRAGDDLLASELSQVRQSLKRGWCQVCGVKLSRGGNPASPKNRCEMHVRRLLSMQASRWLVLPSKS